MGRLFFALIFSSSPAAVDVVRQDKIKGDFAVGATVKFSCFKGKVKGKDVFEEDVDGEILSVGLQKDLRLLNVGPNKSPVAKDQALGARRQEQEKQRMQQVLGTANHLHEINQSLLEAGPSGVAQHQSVSRAKRRPKVPTPTQRLAIQEKFRSLECWKPGRDKLELFGKKVYIYPLQVARLRRKYCKRPKKLYLRMISYFVPDELLTQEGVSARGKMGLVGVDPDIIDVAFAYSLSIFKEAGGDPKTIQWDTEAILETYISNCRRLRKENKSVESDDDDMEAEFEDNPPTINTNKVDDLEIVEESSQTALEINLLNNMNNLNETEAERREQRGDDDNNNNSSHDKQIGQTSWHGIRVMSPVSFVIEPEVETTDRVLTMNEL